MKKKLHKRGVKGAKNYLVSIGYEIIDINWVGELGSIDIVAREMYGNSIVLISVFVTDDMNECFLSEEVSESKRNSLESVAAEFLAKSSFVCCPIRFDTIRMKLVADDRAFLRHCINVLS